MRNLLRLVVGGFWLAAVLAGSATPLASSDSLVTVGSPRGSFPRNVQQEPAIAVDPVHPQVLAAGANDLIDLPPCEANQCVTEASDPPSIMGIYFSFDGGKKWVQPTYTGFSSRTGTLQSSGPTGTVPWYSEAGLTTAGDPALAFGPAPGPDGKFSWSNGSRLYYLALAANVPFRRGTGEDDPVKGFLAITASHTDSPQTAARGGVLGKNAWSRPVFVSNRPSSTTFADKEQVWADNTKSSPFFGNVYACWMSASGASNSSSFPFALMFSRSIDGGETWSPRNQLTEAANTNLLKRFTGRQGCTIRTGSRGTVYVFFEGGSNGQPAQLMTRSFDGGLTFEHAQPVGNVVEVGAFDVFHSRMFYDGVRGARTNSFPSVDIANGAPTGSGATDEIVLVWPDARNGLNQEEALLEYSVDGGSTWSQPVNVAAPGDRPDLPAVAISPDGKDVYLTYDGFLDPYRTTTSDSRRVLGVVRHADVSAGGLVGAFTTLHRGAIGDARASSDPFVCCASNRVEMLGDYNYIVATNDGSIGVWTDVRNASVCTAINDWRQSLLTNPTDAPPPGPAPGTDCPGAFGNSDVYSGIVSDPTP